MAEQSTKPPKSFWILSGVALVWNLMGVMAYVVQSLMPDEAIAALPVAERALYENDVERLIEGYIEEAIDGAGIASTMPLFSDWSLVWPPVEIELTSPPQLLVTSPRDEKSRTRSSSPIPLPVASLG